jgi:hypothetical protein
MNALANRFNFAFRSTKGLVLLAIALIALVAAVFGMLSGPMGELGLKDFIVRVLGMKLLEVEREGRIIMLYHCISMAVVAIEVYLITALVPMKKSEQTRINSTITVGYIVAMFCGLAFAYFGHNFLMHGLFIFGQSLVFFAGIMMAMALWPWKKEYHVKDIAYSHTRGGIDLERTAFFTMAVAMLGSAAFGAAAGSYFGSGFESFLAENVVREPGKTALQLAVIGHLHIMLTLIGIALTLIISRWLDFKGMLHKFAMPLFIAGTIIVTLGVWGVVPFEEIAHFIIYGGSVPAALGALLLVIYGWRKFIRERLAEQGITKASFGQRLSALLHDPLKFGMLWQMVFMNFAVTFVGMFMAVTLDEVARTWLAREERVELTGHWHTLSAVIATIILLYYANMIGLKGKIRQWFGWAIIVGSDVAFMAVTFLYTKRLWVSEAGQQPMVNIAVLVADIGLVLVLVVLAALMVWRLVDLFKKKGKWTKELAEQDSASEVSL